VARLRSHDQGFVGVPPDGVFRVLADPATYPTWWPGARANGSGVSLPIRRGTRRFSVDRQREGIGLYLVSEGGSLEWYLEPFDDGTIVNVFLDFEGAGRSARRLLRMRGAIRAALVGLKGTLESES
jgi:uncharacterized protein YndB with AHSA1/START domain